MAAAGGDQSCTQVCVPNTFSTHKAFSLQAREPAGYRAIALACATIAARSKALQASKNCDV